MRECCTRMPSKVRLIGPPGALGAIDMVPSCGSRGVVIEGRKWRKEDKRHGRFNGRPREDFLVRKSKDKGGVERDERTERRVKMQSG